MKVFDNAFQAGRWAPGAVAALGKFDGLHRGHQRVIGRAVRRAKALATKAVLVTFDPSPQEYFNPGSAKPILPRAEMLELLGRLGIEAVVFLPFNRRLACQAPEAFAKDVLAGALKVMEVCVGSDFCFGKDRAGRVPHLKVFGREFGFLVSPVPLLRHDGERISSSAIRRLLDQGRRREAAQLLGRASSPFERRKTGRAEPLTSEDWIHSTGKRAWAWASARDAQKTLRELAGAESELDQRRPRLLRELDLDRTLDYLLEPKHAAPASLLGHPSLRGWLACARGLAEGPLDPAPEARMLAAQLHGFSASLAAQRGDALAFRSILDHRGHFHFYGLRAYLDLGPKAALRPVELAFGPGGLAVGFEGRIVTLPRELLLDGLSSPTPGRQAPHLARVEGLCLRWQPAVTMSLEAVDCNPLLMPRAAARRGPHEAAVAELPPAQMARFVSVLRQGMAEIAAVDPFLAAELADGVRAIVPLSRPDPKVHVSSTYSHLRGAIFLCHDDNPLVQAETLVHEFAHNKLNLLLEAQPFFEEGGDQTRYYSPWRPDPRTPRGLLLGAHAFLNVARFLAAVARLKKPAKLAARLQTEAAMRCLQVEAALEALAAGPSLTPTGEGLLRGMRRSLELVSAQLPPRPRGIWGAALQPVEAHRRLHKDESSFLHRDAAGGR